MLKKEYSNNYNIINDSRLKLFLKIEFPYQLSMQISCNAVITKNHFKSMVVQLILIQRKTASTCK